MPSPSRPPANGHEPANQPSQGGPDEAPPSSPVGPVPPAPPSWRAPLIASGLAALGLLMLLVPGVLKYPERESGREAVELQQLKNTNASLEAQLVALQDAARDRVCRVGDPFIQVPDKSKPDAPPTKMELVPRPPDQVPLPSPAQTQDGDKSTVAGLLEQASVLVFAVKSDNSAKQGTGFFVNDHDIITNRHVVDQIDPNRIFVASRALGGIRHARLVSRSDENPKNSDVGLDIAVLELEPGSSSAISLPIGTTPAKLSTVYVAGFPGFITEEDSAFGSFLRKLSESLRKDDIEEALRQSHAAVPSPDLRFGRVNNIIKAGTQELPIILHDMQLAPGHSGGPLVDACGRVGGINTWVRQNGDGPQQANLAQDASLISQYLKEHNIGFKSDESPCVTSPSIAQTQSQPAPK